MKLTASTAVLAVLMTLVSSHSSGQSRSRPQAFEGLITLPSRNVPPPASLAGIVVSEETGMPLAGATITLTRNFGNAVLALLAEGPAPTSVTPVQTNENGRFQFPSVAAGGYDVAIERKGYLPLKPGHARITLPAGQRVDGFRLALTRSAQIDGLIRSGDQFAAGIPVHLVKTDAMDTPVAQTITAADGSYHLEGFSPGRFILVAGSPLVLEGQPPRSFAAQVVAQTVDPLKVDLSLDLKGGFAIRGKIGVIGLDIPPSDVGMAVNVMPKQDGKVRNEIANPNFKYDAKDGTFEISGLFPGIYGLHASLQVPGFCGGAQTGLLVSRSDVTGVEMMMSVGCQ